MAIQLASTQAPFPLGLLEDSIAEPFNQGVVTNYNEQNALLVQELDADSVLTDVNGAFEKLNFSDGAASSERDAHGALGKTGKESLNPDLEKGALEAQQSKSLKYGPDSSNKKQELCQDSDEELSEFSDKDEGWEDDEWDEHVDDTTFEELTNNYYRGLIETMDADSIEDDEPNPYVVKLDLEHERRRERDERFLKAFATLQGAALLDFLKENNYTLKFKSFTNGQSQMV